MRCRVPRRGGHEIRGPLALDKELATVQLPDLDTRVANHDPVHDERVVEQQAIERDTDPDFIGRNDAQRPAGL